MVNTHDGGVVVSSASVTSVRETAAWGYTLTLSQRERRGEWEDRRRGKRKIRFHNATTASVRETEPREGRYL